MSAPSHNLPHYDHGDQGHHDHGDDGQKNIVFGVSLLSQSALIRCACVIAILAPLWIAVLWVIRS